MVFDPYDGRPAVAPEPIPLLDDYEVLRATDRELARMLQRAAPHSPYGLHVVRLSENVLVKFGEHLEPSEALVMRLVSAKFPTIRLPQILRAFRLGKIWYFCMEFVHGETLEACWDGLTEEEQENVCSQTADALQELHSWQVFTRPGPIDLVGRTCKSISFLFGFDNDAGPFASLRELEDWFEHRLRVSKNLRKECIGWVPPNTPGFIGTFGDAVGLAHMDLKCRNIVLESDGTVCLLDWGFAGAYPAHFEVIELCSCNARDEAFSLGVRRRLPSYEDEISRIRTIGWAIFYYAR